MNDVLDWYPLGFSVFYPATAIYGRSWLLKRRTGVSRTLTSSGGKRAGFDRHTIMAVIFHGSMIGVAVQAVLRTGLIPGYERLWLIPGLDQPWIAFAGAMITFASWWIIWWAQESLGDAWRIGVDPSVKNRLKTGGLYASIRHPIYTALLGITIGLLFLMPTVLSLLTVLVTFLGLRAEIALEEAHLVGVHGEQYRNYMNHTGRWLPWI